MTSWGVLAVTLHEGSYDYQFLKANGNNNDAGSRSCHSAPVFSTDLVDRTDAEGAASASTPTPPTPTRPTR